MAARNRFSHHLGLTGSEKNYASSSNDIGDSLINSFPNQSQPAAMTMHDRTNEFRAVLKTFRSSQKNGSLQPNKVTSPLAKRTEFSKHSKRIGQDLAKTYEKLEKLTLLCKKRTLFDDRPVEIHELTYVIKQDITSLKRQIQQLEEFKAKSESVQKKDARKHNTSIVKTLQSKLVGMSENFKSVLEIRRENMKQQQMRKNQFSGSNLQALHPPSAGGSLLLMDDQRSNNMAGECAVTIGSGQSESSQYQTMQLIDKQDTYITERAETMETIESTIVELGSIFQQLATVVKEQEEQVLRIDSSVEESELNVQAAHGEILQYFQGITSNRWLMIKVFLTLIAFFLVFVVFFA